MFLLKKEEKFIVNNKVCICICKQDKRVIFECGHNVCIPCAMKTRSKRDIGIFPYITCICPICFADTKIVLINLLCGSCVTTDKPFCNSEMEDKLNIKTLNYAEKYLIFGELILSYCSTDIKIEEKALIMSKLNSTSYTSFVMNKCNIPDMKEFLLPFKDNKSLLKIDLTGNRLAGNDLDFLNELLKENNTVKILTLDDNLMCNYDFVGPLLKSNSTIQELSLCYNNISTKGSESIAKALRNNETLVKLNLWDNFIGNKGSDCIMNEIRTNNTLIYLNVGRNYIDDNAADAILKCLASNNVLQEFNLSDNRIGNEGIITISNAFLENFSLLEVDFSLNEITDKGADGILSNVAGNANLRIIKMKGNTIAKDSLRNLLKEETRIIFY